ncbi:hypothetical protein [Cohnella sp. AR92]|uniref:hypothetical protein n=1 Tax=Cohnella sp. AR92 TaxID=648716 RepID=UPI000F8F5035|nr:hypothetical protein [Cohnella sp. AR92]RUS46346.1 hypothetical protein ELR57_14820 [Cohnella sp. AR92]
MFKRRGLLIGLGLGLMLGASMLQLIQAAEKGSSSFGLSGASLTAEELKQEAKAQGFALVDSTAKTYSQEELDAAVRKAEEEKSASKDADSQDHQGSEANQGSQDNQGGKDSPATGNAGAAESSKDAEAGPTPAKEEHTYSFYIRNNASLVEVATGLQELGLIEDKDRFVKQAKPYSGKLRVGTSTFVGKPSFQEIINEITRAKY